MKLTYIATICGLLGLLSSPLVAAQDAPTCDDIQWSSAVTDVYADVASACNAVMEKDGQLYARVSVEVVRVRNDVLTFRVINPDGSRGGMFRQNLGYNWRADVAGTSVRATDLMEGQRLNVYLPGDRWAVIHQGAEGPALEAVVVPAVAVMEPPRELPKTASAWPLVGALGAGLLLLGAAFTLVRVQRRR